MIFRQIQSPIIRYEGNSGRFAQKGFDGERLVAKSINRHFGSSQKTAILHDLTLRHNQVTIQIDHLVIIPHMRQTWLIETKNFSGLTKIHENGSWTQSFGDRESPIPSPLDQIDGALSVLRNWMRDNGYSRFSNITPVLAIPHNMALDSSSYESSTPIVRSDAFGHFMNQIVDDMDVISFARSAWALFRKSQKDIELIREMADALIKADATTRKHMPPFLVEKNINGSATIKHKDSLEQSISIQEGYEIAEGIYAKKCQSGYAIKIRHSHRLYPKIDLLARGLGIYENDYENWIIREDSMDEFESRIQRAHNS